MTDEFKLIRDRARGDRFRQFMEHDEFRATIRALELEYFKKWAGTQAHEGAYREQIYRQMVALADTLRHMLSVANGGKLATAQLKMMEEEGRKNESR